LKRYKKKSDYEKALSKNGKIYNSSLMVGVVGCIDKSVISQKNHNIVIETPNHVEESILNDDEFPKKKKRKYSDYIFKV
jgi:hypothetical protein